MFLELCVFICVYKFLTVTGMKDKHRNAGLTGNDISTTYIQHTHLNDSKINISLNAHHRVNTALQNVQYQRNMICNLTYSSHPFTNVLSFLITSSQSLIC